MTEPNIDPENRTICPNTTRQHQWVWDDDKDDWYCDECGVWHEEQEDE
jgi:rubredoxin